MMQYYFYVPDLDRYDNLQPADLNWEPFEVCDGRRLFEVWAPVRVRWDTIDNTGEQQMRGDFPGLISHVPIFSERALGILNSLLDESIEALPLECPDQKMFAINVREVIDCLDRERSVVERFASSGRIMRIRKYSFKEDMLREKHIFKIPDIRCCRPLVSERFKEEVEKHGLHGLIFTREWFGEELA